jgi:hypothetical protein
MRLLRNQILVAGGVAFLLVAGLVQLHRLRFQAGDIFPAYSTLRADPVGAKALYESLDRLPGVTAARGLRPLPKLEVEPGSTVLYLGDRLDSYEYMPPQFTKALDTLMAQGGRLVITLAPRDRPAYEEEEEEEEPAAIEGEGKDGAEGEEEAKSEDEEKHICKAGRGRKGCPGGGACGIPKDWTRIAAWLDLEVLDGEHAFHGVARRTDAAPANLPDALPCHTLRYLASSNGTWRVLYTREEQPVVMERAIGSGTVVLSALSYVVSNEALRNERHPAFLAWLIGDTTRAVFDETHHGIEHRLSMMTLARAYGFEYVLLALAGVAVLFIWKQSVGLLPPVTDSGRTDTDVAEGRGSTAGMVNLLRRSVPRDQVIDQILVACRREHRDAPEETVRRIDRLEELHRAAGPAERKDVPGHYNLLQKAWKEERWKRST